MSLYSEIFLSQKEFYKSGRTLELSFRKSMLKSLYHYIDTNQSEICDALKKDLGKGRHEAYITEVGTSLAEIRLLIRNLKKWTGKQNKRTPLLHFPGKSSITLDPYGQNLIIGPWNYPFMLIAIPLAGAIAAGNTIILKPSELSGATSDLFVKMTTSLFESQYIHCFTGGVETTQGLLKLDLDHIFFTGSQRVGKIIMEAASHNLTPVTLELGGKNPVVVERSADLKKAAKRIVWGKFINAGQTCVGPDHVYVHEEIKEELINRMKFYIKEFYTDDPASSPDYMKIVNTNNFNNLLSLLKDCHIIHGGTYNSEDGYFAPTIVLDPPENSKIMEEEIFGPILPVSGYMNLEEVIQRITKRPKPLSFYVFTRSKKIAKKLLAAIPSGNCAVNDTVIQFANSKLPFGGVGKSGTGLYHGKYNILAFSHLKSVYKRSSIGDTWLRYPPYNELNFRLIKKFLK